MKPNYSEDLLYEVMLTEMKNIIEFEETEGNDPYETTYEKAIMIAAAYRILRHYTNGSDFKAFCELRRLVREKHYGND